MWNLNCLRKSIQIIQYIGSSCVFSMDGGISVVSERHGFVECLRLRVVRADLKKNITRNV